MTATVGISAFGLRDVTSDADGHLRSDGSFSPAGVLLPEEILGEVLTGASAKLQRIHTGLSWPLEARVPEDAPLRRAPVSVLWRAMVESGERQAVWKTASSYDFSIGKLLAHYIRDLCRSAAALDDHSQASSSDADRQAVIAIPNTLDESGQDDLLRECLNLGMPEPLLIWRPVAAALAWLKDMEPYLLTRISAEQQSDHIHVLYFGADALECTTLRLRRYSYKGKDYILPLRDRPTDIPALTGLDLAATLVNNFCSQDDRGAFWQVFTIFPEIWQALAASPLNSRELPRPWYKEGAWEFWQPDTADLLKKILSAPAGSSRTLRSLLKNSCPLQAHREDGREKFCVRAEQEVSKLLREAPRGKLHGVIVCGPFVPRDSIRRSWVLPVLAPLQQAISQIADTPQPDSLWWSAGHEAMALGSAIYGERRSRDIPAYLDTMPQISLFTETAGRQQWHPLINAQEVLGGEDFEDTISGKFVLPANQKELTILLCKGPVPGEDASNDWKQYQDLTPCRARVVRHWLRTRCDSYSTACKRVRFLPLWAQDYAVAHASRLFEDSTPARQVALEETPYRSNRVEFPSAPEEDVLLDVHVSMKPAAGLARVVFIPGDADFEAGRRIRMNYATMQAAPAPELKHSWPDLLEIAAHPEDPALCLAQGEKLIAKFENTKPGSGDYICILGDIQKKCLKAPYSYDFDTYTTTRFNLNPVSEKGTCCTVKGNENLYRIQTKIENDFEQKNRLSEIDKFIVRVTWMMASTPENVKDFLREKLRGHMLIGTDIENASKCFDSEEDIRLLFEAIVRMGRTKFTIKCVRSASRVLRYRAAAVNALNDKTACILAGSTIDVMGNEAKKYNFKQSFFQGALLLLYLLRYRKNSDVFYDKFIIDKYFTNCEKLIKQSIQFFKSNGNTRDAEKREKALQTFHDFVEQKATGSYPGAVMDLAEDD